VNAAAIRGGATGTIAICFVEWSGAGEQNVVADWTVIRDAASAKAFSEKLAAAPRSFWGRTAISAGIDHAVGMLAESGYNASRRTIDVCGDGTNNAGREVSASRDDAIAAGITINGLAIINEHPVSWTFAHVQPPGGLPEWYRQNVIGGPGAFLRVVEDFRSFADAMTNKLVSEIVTLAPEDRAAALR